MSDAALSWGVQLPERAARAGLGARQPLARLSVSTAERGEETFSIPVAVARRLTSECEGEGPSCRAELLHQVSELSLACAHARMEELVGKRDYSARELSDRLRSYGYGSDIVGRLVERACQTGIVDDARYGAAFVRSKTLAGWGRIKVERELARRGVSVADIPGWPDEFFSADEERCRALALASRRRLTGKNDYQKIVRFLCARGFSLQLSCSVAREVLDVEAD